MGTRKIYADLLQVTKSMEVDLGLDGLTHTDQQVLATIVLLSNDGQSETLLQDLKVHTLTKNIPATSLYRPLKNLMEHGIVLKIGSERSGIYKLA
jgi:predicted transcriptional regulator